MRIVCTAPMRYVMRPVVMLAVLCVSPCIASAQGLGVGARLAWVHADSTADVDSVRFTGGQIRLVSQRWGLEVSLDHHSESFELLNQKVTETPIQTSVFLRMGGGRTSLFLLGGPGWYKRKVKPIDGPEVLNVDSTEFGWHAGVGLEIFAMRHLGIHGDYRYTFLDFGKDDNEGLVGGLLPGHRGSMWTLGTTVYF
jgi:opacity protein-like surface antigen